MDSNQRFQSDNPQAQDDEVVIVEESSSEDEFVESSPVASTSTTIMSLSTTAVASNTTGILTGGVSSLQNQIPSPGGTQSQNQTTTTDIRSKIESARLLLRGAELQSRPDSTSLVSAISNSNSNSDGSGSQSGASSSLNLNRYAISRNVTPNDFFRERDLSSLCALTTLLWTRLSVDRIFNLGRPQCAQERELFDELMTSGLMDHLISGEQDTGTSSSNHDSTGTTENHPSSSTLVTDGSTAQAQDGPIVTSNNASTFTSHGKSDSNRMLDIVQSLRQYIEDNSETVVGDKALLKVVSEFIQSLKKSPLLSPAIDFSPRKTPSKSRKRQRHSEDSSPKDAGIGETSDDEEESCTICLEPWTTGGEHRICCLKCGHMFGYSCICKWIKQAHSCPQCKMTAKKDDIRNLFARKLTVEDTSERDRAVKLLEEERAKTRSLEHKEALARREVDSQSRLISTLEARIAHLASDDTVSSQGRSEGAGQMRTVDGAADDGGSGSGYSAGLGRRSVIGSTAIRSARDFLTEQSGSRRDHKYQMLARVSIAQDGHCRVFEHCKELGMVVVSTKSSNPLFRGFGIKTLARDFRVLSYQPLHSALIRDLSFRPNTFDGTLLSCGMDKVVQLTSVTSKSVIHKFSLSVSGWCCAWSTTNNNLFYVGTERGLVKEFDIRRTDDPVDAVSTDVLDLGGPPIASVSYWDEEQGIAGASPIKGVLVGQIRNLIFRERRGDAFHTHALPGLQAPIMGTCIAADGHFLTSYRPSGSSHRCQYEVSRLMRGRGDNVISHRVALWEGATVQPVISRNFLFTSPDSDHHDLYAATANHHSNRVSIWDVSGRCEHQSLNCFNKAYDIKTISSNQQDLMGVLCESELVLYKWNAVQIS